MAEGLPPNHEMNPMRAMRLVPQRPPPTLTDPRKWSKDFNDFIALCLTKGAPAPLPADAPLGFDMTASECIWLRCHVFSFFFLVGAFLRANVFVWPCVSPDPENRPDCVELLGHAFIRGSRGSGALKERINECFILKLKEQAAKVPTTHTHQPPPPAATTTSSSTTTTTT